MHNGETASSTAQQLAQTRQRLADTQRLAHVGSWQWNLGTNAVEWSDELYRIYGIGRTDFPGTYEGFAARVHPDDLKSSEQALFNALRGPGPFAYQHRIVRPGGEVRMLDTRGHVTVDDHGKPAFMVGNCWDITDVWRTTQALERSVSLLRATLESTADGILVVDSDRRVAAYNQRFLELWRIPPEVAALHDDATLLAAVTSQLEDPAAFLLLVEQLYQSPEQDSHDVLHFLDRRIFERYSQPQWVGNTVVGRVWSFRDVTEREQLLSGARFLADATRLLASLDGRSALEAMAHLSVPLLGEVCIIDLVADSAGEESPPLISAVWPGAAPPNAATLPARGRIAQPVIDNLGPRAVIAVPLRGREGPIGTLAFHGQKDRQYRQSDLSLVEELGRRATLSIENARLYRRACAARSAHEDLIAIAAHEIRGPLTAQRLAIQGIDSSDVPDAARARLMHLVRRENERLSHFVDELSDVTKIEAGSFHFERERVDLTSVVREVASQMATEVARSGSPLEVTAVGAAVGTWDRRRLEQVVRHLLANAIKFGAGKPISIKVSSDGKLAQVSVRDRGMGIPPANHRRVFLPFERAASSRNFGGLGLGLYIVQTVVEGLGGTVRLQSAVDEGSTFTVELPIDPPTDRRADSTNGPQSQ